LIGLKKSRIGGKQYLDYLWELGELPVYTIGGFGIFVSLRYDCPYIVRIRGSSHSCAIIQDVVKRQMKKLKNVSTNKKGKPMRENPRANGLARGEGSCAHPIPYASMSALVRFMVGVWVVFCVVVSPVFGSSIPVVSKLVLRGSATEPPKVLIHHLAPAWDNSIVNNPCCC
jgi:hypothetical protein